jgi:hypothetical protein
MATIFLYLIEVKLKNVDNIVTYLIIRIKLHLFRPLFYYIFAFQTVGRDLLMGVLESLFHTRDWQASKSVR